MKKVFELEYPDGSMVSCAMLQDTLCRQWGLPVHVREVGTGDDEDEDDDRTPFEKELGLAGRKEMARIAEELAKPHCGGSPGVTLMPNGATP